MSDPAEASQAIPANPDKGSLSSPGQRLKSVEKARALWQLLRDADFQGAQDRALLLDQFTGALPFRPEDLQEGGRPDQYNINFNLGAAQIRQKITSYHDLSTSVPVMARPVMKPWVSQKYHNTDTLRFSQQMASEFHRINTVEWTDFFFQNIRLEWHFCFHGIGITYFIDDIDWRWNADGLDLWKFPRKQRLSADAIEYCAGQRYYTAADLIGMLGTNEEAAGKRGWNIPAMKAAMQTLCTEDEYRYNFEGWVKMIKDNDLFYRNSDVNTTSAIRMLVREFDNTYTLLIFTEDKLKDDDGFLYEGPSDFDCASDAIVIFPLEPGLGDIYSVRGYAYQLYETDLARNRFFSILLDNAQNASGNMIQAETDDAKDDFAWERIGNTTVIGPNLKYIPIPMPNYAQSIIPITGIIAQLGQQAMGSYAGDSGQQVEGGDSRKTATQEKLDAVKEGELSSSERTNFYNGKQLVYNAQWKRMMDKRVSAETPGGAQVMEMRKRLKEQGVPDEVVEKGVDYWRPLRAVGNGSASAEVVNTQQLLSLSGRFDPVGQNNALRGATANIVGWEEVDNYCPALDQPRTTIDAQIAILENIDMGQAQVVPVEPSQPPIIHIKEHVKAMDGLTQFVTQAADEAPLEEANTHITGYEMLISHTEQHMQVAASLQPPPPELKAFTQILGAAKNLFKQLYSVLQKRLQGQQIEQQKQQQEAQAQMFKQAVQVQAQKEAGSNGAGDHMEAMQGLQDRQAQREVQAKINLAEATQQMDIAQAKAEQDLAIARSHAKLKFDNEKIKTVAEIQAKDLSTQQMLNHELLNAQSEPQTGA